MPRRPAPAAPPPAHPPLLHARATAGVDAAKACKNIAVTEGWMSKLSSGAAALERGCSSVMYFTLGVEHGTATAHTAKELGVDWLEDCRGKAWDAWEEGEHTLLALLLGGCAVRGCHAVQHSSCRRTCCTFILIGTLSRLTSDTRCVALRFAALEPVCLATRDSKSLATDLRILDRVRAALEGPSGAGCGTLGGEMLLHIAITLFKMGVNLFDSLDYRSALQCCSEAM